MRQLPLAKPLPTYYVTSAYGPRIDPFTREWAFHTGVDIAGRIKSRVHATLPGIVTFVGNARGYGKMVELDHGHGIKTRYGHLGKTHLKFGQRIKFKQYVGIMAIQAAAPANICITKSSSMTNPTILGNS